MAKKKGSKVGRKPGFILTPEILKEIEILSGRGLTNEHIAHYYGISTGHWFEQIKKHPEIAVAFHAGKAKTISFVTGKLMEQVKRGNLTAIIFYLKTQARWRETNHEPTPADGDKPAPGQLTISVTDPVEAAKIYQRIMTGS